MATPWNAIASGASGLVGGLINKIGQKKTEQRQVQYQKDLADYQYSKDVDMWSMANEYNKPGAQMERLKEAGLNPHLVYGSGSVVGNTSTQTPKYQNPGTQFKNVPIMDPNQMLAQYNNLRTTNQNIDVMKSIQNLNQAKAGTEWFNTQLKEAAAKKAGLDVEWTPVLNQSTLELRQAEKKRKDTEIDKILQDTSKSKHQTRFEKEKADRAEKGIFSGDSDTKTFFQVMERLYKSMNFKGIQTPTLKW